MAPGRLDVPRDGPSQGVGARGPYGDAGSAEAQSAEPASVRILHHTAAAHAPFARYRRIFARAPHTCIEHQRPRPAGLRS
ncbi:hypothetical protein GCM10010345_62730 [Streptomyces canarius]|uniref:Uncharacterized protein n=1 Tax=Streptomyces canarius TaxID=285453 RepID=A0ABQ3D0P2_9ACTN|nr:hypothetical protein GCM10010345_62730 [Streptomyces canarius]